MILRDRVEAAFGRLAVEILRQRALVIAASLLVIGLLSTGLPKLEIETSFDRYLPRDNPAQQLYQQFRSEFGSGERIVVLIRPDELYDLRFLGELRRLHSALEAGVPYLDDLTSLVNARFLIGGPGTLTSEGLLDEPVRDEADLVRLRDRIRSNPIYRNVIISADQDATALIIELDGSLGESDVSETEEALQAGFDEPPDSQVAAMPGALLSTEQSEHLVRVLEKILAENAPSGAQVFVAGTPLLAYRLGAMLTRDIFLFVAVSVILTALLLGLMFRNVWATIHPLLVVGLSVVGTLGWMGLVGIPITAVTEILPSLLLAMGIGDSVHIQSAFYLRRGSGQDVSASIRWALEHSGLAVLLTSLTTAASMASFQVAELQPIIDLGRVAPVGVALALVLSTTLLPALLSLTPMDPPGGHSNLGAGASFVDRLLMRLGSLGLVRPGVVMAVTGLLLVWAVVGAFRLRFSQDDLRWLPEEDPVRMATEELNRSMRGAEPFELYVRLAQDRDLREPEILGALREVEARASLLRVGWVEVAQSLSLIDVLEETHGALRDAGDREHGMPDSREAVSQELLLFESAAPDDLARLVDAEWRTTRVAMTVPFVDALHYPRFSRSVEALIDETLLSRGLEESVEISPTGLLMVAGETFQLLFVSMARSYVVAFGVIAILMLVLIGDLKLGVLSMIPNLIPILVVLGLMGWVDAPLDISSMLVGGILIGVVVDDTIHFAHNFARYRTETGCSFQAIQKTLLTTGHAMWVTSIILSIGFFAFIAASLENISDFGLYCGVGVILAFVADVVLMPALITVAAPCSPGCPCRESRRIPIQPIEVVSVRDRGDA